MERKFKLIINLVLFLIIVVFLFMYQGRYINNLSKKKSYYHYKLSRSIEYNDQESAKIYAKKILKLRNKDIYYDMACFFLFKTYEKENKNKKKFIYKNKLIENKKSIFKKILL